MSEPRCETCRFWATGAKGLVEGAGECRRRSPVYVLHGRYEYSEWPATFRTAFCGEHEPRHAVSSEVVDLPPPVSGN